LLFGVASVVEILAATRCPRSTISWTRFSTVLRPAAGSLLAASVLWPVEGSAGGAGAGVAVGAPTALAPHALKSMARAASTTFTAGFANPSSAWSRTVW
jgi:hypothetical protein